MLPALNQARESAKSGACLSNLRQSATAALLYANDNRHIIMSSTAHRPSWVGFLIPEESVYFNTGMGGKYLPGNKVAFCPSSEYTDGNFNTYGMVIPEVSVINPSLKWFSPNDSGTELVALPLDLVEKPSVSVLLADTATLAFMDGHVAKASLPALQSQKYLYQRMRPAFYSDSEGGRNRWRTNFSGVLFPNGVKSTWTPN